MGREKLYYLGIKGLIRNSEGKILVLKASLRNHTPDSLPYWDIPGGRVEEGDDPITTLRREIEEEIGVSEVTGPKLMTAVISRHEIPLNDGKRAGLVLMIYTVRIPGGSKIRLSPEHTDYEWVDTGEARVRLENKYPPEFLNILSAENY